MDRSRTPEGRTLCSAPQFYEKHSTHSWWRDLDGGADVGAARGVIRSFRKSSLVSLDLQGKASTITTPSQRPAAAWALLSSHSARSGSPTGRSQPSAARGGLRAPGSPPPAQPNPAQPSAALTGGRSVSRPHRAHRGPAGWRTAHLRGQRQGGAQGPRSGGRPRSAATATARTQPGGGAPRRHRRGHRAVTTLSRHCHDTVTTLRPQHSPSRSGISAELRSPQRPRRKCRKLPSLPAPPSPPRSVIGQLPQGERGDWPAPPRGPAPRLAERTRWRRRP